MQKSKNGTFSPKIEKAINEKLSMICLITGQNRTEYVNHVVKKAIEEDIKKLKKLLESEELSE